MTYLGRLTGCVHYHQSSSMKLVTHSTEVYPNSVNPLTPKIWLLILSSNCYTFSCKLIAYKNLVLDQDNFYLMS